MRVKNLISHNKIQQLFSNDFGQALVPPPIIRELRSFLYLLHRDSESWFILVHFGSISHISYFDSHFYLEQRKYFSVGIIHF